MVLIEASPRPPTDMLNEIEVGRPVCSKKYVGVPPHGRVTKGLCRKYHARNFGTTQIYPSEIILVACALVYLLLQLIGMDHHH